MLGFFLFNLNNFSNIFELIFEELKLNHNSEIFYKCFVITFFVKGVSYISCEYKLFRFI